MQKESQEKEESKGVEKERIGKFKSREQKA